MTIQSAILLKKLKTAQSCEDNTVAIDFQALKAWTIPSGDQRQSLKQVNLKWYDGSLVSTLDHLQKLEYLEYNYHMGQAHVTHSGWNAITGTVHTAINFTVKDVLVPVLVSVLTAVITTAILD